MDFVIDSFVIDTNVLFSYFREGSFVNRAIKSGLLNLFSPESALDELDRYSETICSKSGVSDARFRTLLEELKMHISFVPIIEHSRFFGEVKLMAENLGRKDAEELLDDADFVSLSLKLQLPLWSNDKIFRKVADIRSFTTAEVIELLKLF